MKQNLAQCKIIGISIETTNEGGKYIKRLAKGEMPYNSGSYEKP